MPAVWLCLVLLKEYLFEMKFLNNRDLGFVGGENGTPWEYFTNIWHWDAAMLLLLPISLICLAVGAVLLLGRKATRDAESKTAQKRLHQN
jgi:hypothetical protein